MRKDLLILNDYEEEKIMDARTFATFLKDILLKEAKNYEGNLLSANYETLADAKRVGGIRDTLVGVANSLEKVLADFYDKGGNVVLDSQSSDEGANLE
jgi:hypothetical protein